MKSILKVSFISVVLGSALSMSACGAAGDDPTAASDEVLASSEEAIVGAKCSPKPNGPAPMCSSKKEYCNLGSTCGSTGSCAAVPSICPKNIAWVCGCDNRNYTNSCEAARAGVSVKKKGRC